MIMPRCELPCESGWLPVDREEDHDAIIEEAGEHREQVYIPLLVPSQFLPCFKCNPLSMDGFPSPYNPL